jgi:acyl carrier protein
MVEKPSDIEARLLGFVREKLIETGEGTAAATDLFASGLDSMGIMQLMIHIEEVFGVRVPEAEVTKENFASVASLAALVRRCARP